MRLDLPADLRCVHEMHIPVRWGDMDALGHVNNTVYFRFMESLRIDWLHALGAWGGAGEADARQGPVIVNVFCNFLQQVEFPATLIGRQYLGAIGRSSVDTYARFVRSDAPEVVVAEGGATVVWSDYAARRAIGLPDGLRARLQQLAAG